MAQFRNQITGVVVGVDDSKAERFGSGWEPVDGARNSSGPTGYAALKVADLRAEIEARNADRDEVDQLPVTGVKADLVAVLEVDDAADADEPGDED